ncbi:MAG: hypothetical protein KAG92_01715 [Deltaproteobacteria bacterium]|nr:hypothetical protein [Deltaproteobacteria bacterium]
MKNTLRIVTLVIVLNATTVFAATGAEGAGLGLIGWIFIGFMALIVAFQFIPSVMMFGSMMAAIFGKGKTQGVAAGNGKSNNV